MEPLRKQLFPGATLNYIHTEKFKTGVLSVQLITPLSASAAAAGALLPAVLRRGTVRHGDMRSLSTALDLLYGASVSCTVRKKGENQCLGFIAGFIDEAYVPEPLLEPITELLGELLLEPATKDGCFLPEYVEGEKVNLIDAIESAVNDKREYADMRLLQQMCARERYGVDRLGTVEGVIKLDAQSLYRFYRDLLSTAQIEFFYCGSAEQARVESALMRAFSPLPRGQITPPALSSQIAAPERPRCLEERMDVTQGKLAMGFRCTSADAPAMLLGNLIFGGYSNSKLFMNVREKLSLCYFASSAYHRSKGIITVSSGIEFKNYKIAKDEILAQLAAVQNGEIEPWELEGARNCIISAIRLREDSAGRMEENTLGQSATGLFESADELIGALEAVTAERIAAAAKTITLDTVYFLTGKEETANV